MSFQEISRERAGSKDYWESLWYPSEEEAFRSLQQHAKNFEALKGGEIKSSPSSGPSGALEIIGSRLEGRVRVNTCHCRQLGREVSRLLSSKVFLPEQRLYLYTFQ